MLETNRVSGYRQITLEGSLFNFVYSDNINSSIRVKLLPVFISTHLLNIHPSYNTIPPYAFHIPTLAVVDPSMLPGSIISSVGSLYPDQP